MFRLSAALLCSSLLLLCSPPVRAWNAAGHRLVAAIAWRQMPPEVREQAASLLASHHFYARWTAKPSADPAYQAFVEATTWADDIRNDPRFYDEAEQPPTPALPGLPDTARHKNWHYVDVKGDGRTGELDRQIERLGHLLADPRSSLEGKAYALPWLLHLVGDVHQPLHVGSHDDEGGNGVIVSNPFNPRFPQPRLHTWWDDLPGPPWLRGDRLEAAADALLAAHPQAPRQGNVALWAGESRRLSTTLAYPPTADGPLPVISAEFRDQSRAIAKRRLAEAGYRLGRLLTALFRPVSRETRASGTP